MRFLTLLLIALWLTSCGEQQQPTSASLNGASQPITVESNNQDSASTNPAAEDSASPSVAARFVADLATAPECTLTMQGSLIYVKNEGFYFCDDTTWTAIDLRGSDGRDGRDGRNGIDGRDGSAGPTGVQGPTGPAGADNDPAVWRNPISGNRYILVSGVAANYNSVCPTGSTTPPSEMDILGAYNYFNRTIVANVIPVANSCGYSRLIHRQTGGEWVSCLGETTPYPFLCKLNN